MDSPLIIREWRSIRPEMDARRSFPQIFKVGLILYIIRIFITIWWSGTVINMKKFTHRQIIVVFSFFTNGDVYIESKYIG